MDAALESLFPEEIRPLLRRSLAQHPDAEELRLRVGQPITVQCAGAAHAIPGAKVTPALLDDVLERATQSSVYAHAAQMQQGYLHALGGYRIGLCGTVYDIDGVSGIRQLTSLAVRIPHAVRGCAQEILEPLCKDGFHSTLLLSPPGCGKTTLLRDLIRCLSERGMRIAAADERGELAGVAERELQFDLGPTTDIMSGGTKARSAMMLLRAMNPQILAFDEITAREDLSVISEAAGCGVSLLATAHAASREDLQRRPLYHALLGQGIFRNAVWIRMEAGVRRYAVERL